MHRIALCALLVAASITLAGCSTAVPHRAPAVHTHNATPSASPFHYKDVAANYAVTFPGKPTIAPVQGSDTGAVRATFSDQADPMAPSADYYTAGGTTKTDMEVLPSNLEDALLALVNGGYVLKGPEKKFTVGGMPAMTTDFTSSDGKPGAILMAGGGHSLYQLVVIGDTPKQWQAFFDSFTLLK